MSIGWPKNRWEGQRTRFWKWSRARAVPRAVWGGRSSDSPSTGFTTLVPGTVIPGSSLLPPSSLQITPSRVKIADRNIQLAEPLLFAYLRASREEPCVFFGLLQTQPMENFPQIGRTSRCRGAKTQPIFTIHTLCKVEGSQH